MTFLDDVQPECTDEFDKYLATPFSPNTSVSCFWKENQSHLPSLYKIHESHLTIPATLAGIERAFSTAWLILNDRCLSTHFTVPRRVEG